MFSERTRIDGLKCTDYEVGVLKQRFRMILECHWTLTGMPPFVVAMEEGRYSLWRLRV